jgi:hypothetical protein
MRPIGCERQCSRRKVGDRGNEIVCGGQRRGDAVSKNDRPVLEVHVGITDQRGERQSLHELDHIVESGFGPQHSSEVFVTRPLVLSMRELPEHLREVLDVDASSIMANSVSGTAGYRGDGSLTIHEPPTPCAGIVSPPAAPREPLVVDGAEVLEMIVDEAIER